MPVDFFPGDRIAPTAAQQRLVDVAIWLGLILSTFAVYAQVGGFDFVAYDDGPQVYQNAYVQAGVNPASIRWAFKAVVLGNWMPITLLSHMVDAELFGMDSGMHHFTNVLFHALAAGLLFSVLRRATGARGMSAFVAMLFALHPLHVGSVAWVAERKDVLAAFFWFLALYAYVIYTERPSPGGYLSVAAFFCLGLMSKPMLVTFPFALVLFDIWPLRRAQWPKTILEKLPLFILSAGSAAVTYTVQGSDGALMTIPFRLRIANVFVSYVTYLRQMFWPTRLAVFYPFPHSIAAWKVVLAVAVVLAMSAVAILALRKHPYVTVGWFWFAGTLIPVIGLVQVGMQAHADRYMYIPMVGLLIILVWGGMEIVTRWPRTRLALAAVAIVCSMACMTLARKEASYWRNDETLFGHAIEVTEGNWLAENDLGAHLFGLGHDAEAVAHFQAAVTIEPYYVEAHNNLGVTLLKLEDCAAAVPHFQAALRINPKYANANYNLGRCAMIDENYAAAIPLLEEVIRVRPDVAEAHYRLGLSFSKIPGHIVDAVQEYERALRLAPDDQATREGFEKLVDNIGHSEEAIAYLETTQILHPDPEVSRILDLIHAAELQ